jgi:hypothetical protein
MNHEQDSYQQERHEQKEERFAVHLFTMCRFPAYCFPIYSQFEAHKVLKSQQQANKTIWKNKRPSNLHTPVPPPALSITIQSTISIEVRVAE